MTTQSDSGGNPIEIEFHDTQPGAPTVNGSLRPNGELQGRVPVGAVVTYIDASVIEAAWRHVLSDRRTELGGVLVGQCAEDDGVFARVTALLDARYTTTTAGSLTFSHETWADIGDRMSHQHADARIVGWYHSHPGHGVFMSSYDRFIHENFFRHPWQCALVLDSVRCEAGLFQNVGGRIILSGYRAVPGAPASPRAMRRPSLVIEVVPDGHEVFTEAAKQIVERLAETIGPSLRQYGVEAKVQHWGQPGKHIDDKA